MRRCPFAWIKEIYIACIAKVVLLFLGSWALLAVNKLLTYSVPRFSMEFYKIKLKEIRYKKKYSSVFNWSVKNKDIKILAVRYEVYYGLSGRVCFTPSARRKHVNLTNRRAQGSWFWHIAHPRNTRFDCNYNCCAFFTLALQLTAKWNLLRD